VSRESIRLLGAAEGCALPGPEQLLGVEQPERPELYTFVRWNWFIPAASPVVFPADDLILALGPDGKWFTHRDGTPY